MGREVRAGFHVYKYVYGMAPKQFGTQTTMPKRHRPNSYAKNIPIRLFDQCEISQLQNFANLPFAVMTALDIIR